jgi:hypothetical protein
VLLLIKPDYNVFELNRLVLVYGLAQALAIDNEEKVLDFFIGFHLNNMTPKLNLHPE